MERRPGHIADNLKIIHEVLTKAEELEDEADLQYICKKLQFMAEGTALTRVMGGRPTEPPMCEAESVPDSDTLTDPEHIPG